MTNYRENMSETLEYMAMIRERKILERELSDTELKRREEIAKELPDSDFKDRYGEKWMEVKMATATKMAKKESVEQEKSDLTEAGGLSPAMINKLRKAYSTLNKIDPTSPAGKKMTQMMDKMNKEQLQALVKADIKFISLLAVNRLIRMGMNAAQIRKLKEGQEEFTAMLDRWESEEVELDEKVHWQAQTKDGKGLFQIVDRDTKGMAGKQDKFKMQIVDKRGKVIKDLGSHVSVDSARKFAWNRKIVDPKNLGQMSKDHTQSNLYTDDVDLDEKKDSYELYHKDFSSAMQHAYAHAKRMYGISIDPKEIDDKVATGPRKPGSGKTNKYRLKGDKGAIQVQVYNKGGSKPYELNMYKEEVELDEKLNIDKRREAGQGDWRVTNKDLGVWTGPARSEKDAKEKAMRKWGVSKGKASSPMFMKHTKAVKEEVELDEAKNYEIKNGKIHISKANFRKVHKDYKNSTKGKERMMALDPKSGATTSYEVVFEEVELDEYNEKSVDKEIEKSGIKKGSKEAKLIHRLLKGRRGSKKEEVEVDEKKKEPVFKGTPAQIKKQMKDWKKKHDKVKIGEGYQVYVKSPTAKSGWIPQGQPHKSEADAKKDAKNFRGATRVVKEAWEIGTDEYRKYLEDLTPMEGARSDAMRDMRRAGEFKDKEDDDVTSTKADRKAANKNILQQLKKTIDSKGKADIEFLDKKKNKVPYKVAVEVIRKYMSMRKSSDKLKFQQKVAKSYRDMLAALKENYEVPKTQTETILDRIDAKIKERKNG